MILYGYQYILLSIFNDFLGEINLLLNINKIEIWFCYKLDFVLDKNYLKINYMYDSMSMQVKFML